jgi:hypothetical protein
MSIRTTGQLDRFLSRSLAWRKKELTALKFVVDTAPVPEQNVVLRAAATLLYSHWEGFVKEAGTSYLEFVSRQSLELGQLKSSFLAVSIRRQISQCASAKSVSLHRLLVDRIRSGLANPANLPWKKIIKTRSNLKAANLKEIIDILDLDYGPFELKAKPVINKLVDTRNGIAHGEGIPVDPTEYADLHTEIIILLNEFKSQVQTAASTKKYKI